MMKFFILAILLGASAAYADVPKYFVSDHPRCGSEIPERELEADELRAIFGAQGVTLTTAVDKKFQNIFLLELAKFPGPLMEELLKNDTTIHVLQGNGVTADPSWPKVDTTFDGRSWSFVPGSGGVPGETPTRIVANHLYDGHGSANLFLHEHAHTLDQLYAENVLSSSKTWTQLLAAPEAMTFLEQICGSYCTENANEGFAELFAYYHGCAEAKAHVRNVLPSFADFFDDLVSVKAFRKKERAL